MTTEDINLTDALYPRSLQPVTTPLDFSGRVQSLLSRALQVPLEVITAEMAFGDIPQWDSMGHMEVMMCLEEEFGVEINADTIASLVDIPSICQYLASNNGQRPSEHWPMAAVQNTAEPVEGDEKKKDQAG